MDKASKILILGSSGVVGYGLSYALAVQGFKNVIKHTRMECDLLDFAATRQYLADLSPDFVFHLAGQVYGIMGNIRNKALSYLNNNLINTHVIESCHLAGVKKIVSMGTGAVYPYPSPGLPLKEEMIFKGEPHSSENSYAHAKRGMYAMHRAYEESYGMQFAYVISANIFGPNDRFDTEFGHVVPSLVRKFYEAVKYGGNVSIWGDGSAQRDFIYATYVGNALLRIMEQVSGPVNMGSGNVSSIKNIVDILANITGIENRIEWDASKPNGQDFREYDLSILINTNFKPSIDLEQGLNKTYKWYAENFATARR